MAEKKNESEAELQETVKKEEEKIKRIIDETNERLMKEMEGKPYLLVIETLHEVGREGGTSKLAAQWSWRSNLDSREEGRSAKDVEVSRSLMKFLSERLDDVANHPEFGIKKRYKLE